MKNLLAITLLLACSTAFAQPDAPPPQQQHAVPEHWDVIVPVHDHAEAFIGYIKAKDAKEALRLAKAARYDLNKAYKLDLSKMFVRKMRR